MFILRVVLGVVLVLALVPLGEDSATGDGSTGFPGVGAFVASAAIEDLGGFCERQPAACAVGAEALKSLAERARQGAQAFHAYVIQGAPETTGTAAAPAAPPSQDTLEAADRLPAWRGPRA